MIVDLSKEEIEILLDWFLSVEGEWGEASEGEKKLAAKLKEVGVMEDHILVIDSLHDAQAHCMCGKWQYAFTGEKTAKEVFECYKEHVERMTGCKRVVLTSFLTNTRTL